MVFLLWTIVWKFTPKWLSGNLLQNGYTKLNPDPSANEAHPQANVVDATRQVPDDHPIASFQLTFNRGAVRVEVSGKLVNNEIEFSIRDHKFDDNLIAVDVHFSEFKDGTPEVRCTKVKQILRTLFPPVGAS